MKGIGIGGGLDKLFGWGSWVAGASHSKSPHNQPRTCDYKQNLLSTVSTIPHRAGDLGFAKQPPGFQLARQRRK